MPGPIAPVNCPKCGGPMWDNMDSPKKGPKAPDYACKDKTSCGAGVWLSDTERNARRATAPASQGGGGPARPQGNIILDTMMYRCMQSAHAILEKFVKDGKISSYSSDNLVNMSTSLYIGRTKDRTGILKIEKPAAAPPKPEPPPPPPPPPQPAAPPEDPRGHGYYDSPGADDDLPF